MRGSLEKRLNIVKKEQSYSPNLRSMPYNTRKMQKQRSICKGIHSQALLT